MPTLDSRFADAEVRAQILKLWVGEGLNWRRQACGTLDQVSVALSITGVPVTRGPSLTKANI